MCIRDSFVAVRFEIRAGQFDGEGVIQRPDHPWRAGLIEQVDEDGGAGDRVHRDRTEPRPENLVGHENALLHRDSTHLGEAGHLDGRKYGRVSIAIRDGLYLVLQPRHLLKHRIARDAGDREIEFGEWPSALFLGCLLYTSRCV